MSARYAGGKRLALFEGDCRVMSGVQDQCRHPHFPEHGRYVHVTEGTARFGIEGQPVKEVKTGESFFEPPGALHTVMESASTTEGAKAIAVMIVPDGAPLTLPAQP